MTGIAQPQPWIEYPRSMRICRKDVCFGDGEWEEVFYPQHAQYGDGYWYQFIDRSPNGALDWPVGFESRAKAQAWLERVEACVYQAELVEYDQVEPQTPPGGWPSLWDQFCGWLLGKPEVKQPPRWRR